MRVRTCAPSGRLFQSLQVRLLLHVRMCSFRCNRITHVFQSHSFRGLGQIVSKSLAVLLGISTRLMREDVILA